MCYICKYICCITEAIQDQCAIYVNISVVLQRLSRINVLYMCYMEEQCSQELSYITEVVELWESLEAKERVLSSIEPPLITCISNETNEYSTINEFLPCYSSTPVITFTSLHAIAAHL